MAATLCAYCKARVNMMPIWGHSDLRPSSGLIGSFEDEAAVVAMCAECHMLSVAVVATPMQLVSRIDDDSPRHADLALSKAYRTTWYPTAASSYTFSYAPDHIARAAEEAHQCAEVGCTSAAVLMARTTVEATAKDKGILVRGIAPKIDELQAQGFIRATVAEAAHAIRFLGNDAAHGDLDDLPTEEDVADVLDLMDTVLREVYETGGITARILSRRKG